jgi:hypothetical protein
MRNGTDPASGADYSDPSAVKQASQLQMGDRSTSPSPRYSNHRPSGAPMRRGQPRRLSFKGDSKGARRRPLSRFLGVGDPMVPLQDSSSLARRPQRRSVALRRERGLAPARDGSSPNTAVKSLRFVADRGDSSSVGVTAIILRLVSFGGRPPRTGRPLSLSAAPASMWTRSIFRDWTAAFPLSCGRPGPPCRRRP